MKTDDKQANVDAALGMYAACSVSDKDLNAMRIGYAQAAIDGYIAATPDKQHEDKEETLTDVLTDLMHWAHEQDDVDFLLAIRVAQIHFQDEQDQL